MSALILLLKVFLYFLPFVILFIAVRETYYIVKIRLVNKLVYSREFSTSGTFVEES